MFIAIISSILDAFSQIYWKKTLSYRIPEFFNNLFGYSMGICFVLYFILVVDFSILDYKFFLLIFLMVIIDVIKNKISQTVYREEKISVLMPYTNINKIFIIILGFLVYSDVSATSFLITLFTIFLIILFSVDFKNFKLPKNLKKMFVFQTLKSLSYFIVGYLVIWYGNGLLFIFDFTVGTFFLFLISIYFGYFSNFKKLDKNYFIPKLSASFLGWGAYAISLILISDLGLTISILLSFVGMGITLLLSFLILRDKPNIKDIVLTIIVTLLVGIGFYFK